jgi:hypothetical protein
LKKTVVTSLKNTGTNTKYLTIKLLTLTDLRDSRETAVRRLGGCFEIAVSQRGQEPLNMEA